MTHFFSSVRRDEEEEGRKEAWREGGREGRREGGGVEYYAVGTQLSLTISHLRSLPPSLPPSLLPPQGPLLLKQLIMYLGSDEPPYRGYEYLGMLFAAGGWPEGGREGGREREKGAPRCLWHSHTSHTPHLHPSLPSLAVCSSICLHQYFHRCFRTGMRLKSAIIGLVYKKALKIRPGQSKGKHASEEGAPPATTNGSSSNRRSSRSSRSSNTTQPEAVKRNVEAKSTGEITNLMAVDAQRLQDLMSYFSTLVRRKE